MSQSKKKKKMFVQNSGLELVDKYAVGGLAQDLIGPIMKVLLHLARDTELRSIVVSKAGIVKMVLDLLQVGPNNQQLEVVIRLFEYWLVVSCLFFFVTMTKS